MAVFIGADSLECLKCF